MPPLRRHSRRAAMPPVPFHHAATPPVPFYNFAAAPPAPYYNHAAAPPLLLGVPVRPVWTHNFNAEMDAVQAFSMRARHVAFSVHYPGVVHCADTDPVGAELTVEKRYAVVKANVDALKLLQLGLAIVRDDGLMMGWEFNLRGFDPKSDLHSARSLAYLAGRGMDLDMHHLHGVPVALLSMRLHHCGLLRRPELSWVTYSADYHTAYLLKLLTAEQPLPGDIAGFLALVRRFFWGDVQDVARMASDPPVLPVGLERLASALGLPQPLVSLAGARAVLALQAFMSLGPRLYRGFAPLI